MACRQLHLCAALTLAPRRVHPGDHQENPYLELSGSIVASLNEALVEACKRLGTSENGLRYLLDVKLADDNEVANRRGYGALVQSMYVRPTEVWSR